MNSNIDYLEKLESDPNQSKRDKIKKLSELREVNTYTQFLIFSYLYSDILTPYKNKKGDHIGKFFDQDDSFIYSFIIHTNISKIGELVHTNIVDLKQTGDINSSEVYLKTLTILITDYVELTFSWYNNLSNGNIVKNELLQCAIDDFVPKLYVLYSIISTLNKRHPKEYYQRFLKIVEYGHKTYNFPLNKNIEISKNDNKNLNEYVFDAFRDVSELILLGLIYG